MNLTESTGVISRERPGFATMPNHDLVVFEETKAGLRFVEVVSQGQDFRPPTSFNPFGRPVYVSIAVSRSEDLRYTTTRDFSHMDPGHEFHLTYDLEFSVADSALIVNRRLDDPLSAVCSEVARVTGGEIRATAWDKVVKSRITDNLATLWTEIWSRHGLSLQAHASRYGISLVRVTTRMGFNAADEAQYKAAADLARQKEIDKSRTEASKLEIEREKRKKIDTIEADKEVATAQHGLEIQKARNAVEINIEQAKGRMVSGATDTILETAQRVAGTIHTVGDFQATMPALHRIIQPLLPAGGGAGGGTGPAGAAGEPQLLLAGTAEQDSPELVRLIQSILTEYGSYAVEEGRNRRFLAAALHWVAELSLGEKANAQRLREYRAALDDMPENLAGKKYDLLARLTQEEQIRVLLS